MALPYPGMDFTAFDTLPAADLDKLVANIEALATGSALTLTPTSYTNAGSAGGTFKYINLGGIKLLWGTTSTVTISGTGFQASSPVAVTLPVGFFSVIHSVTPTPGTAATGTVGIAASVQALSTSSISLALWQGGGTNGAAGISLLVRGA